MRDWGRDLMVSERPRSAARDVGLELVRRRAGLETEGESEVSTGFEESTLESGDNGEESAVRLIVSETIRLRSGFGAKMKERVPLVLRRPGFEETSGLELVEVESDSASGRPMVSPNSLLTLVERWRTAAVVVVDGPAIARLRGM